MPTKCGNATETASCLLLISPLKTPAPLTFSFLRKKERWRETKQNCKQLPVTRWLGVLSIQPKLPKFSKQGQMVRKFPGIGPKKSVNCWISEKWINQPKMMEIQGWKSNGTEISRKTFTKIWVFAIFYSALFLLAAITVSWTSHTKITASSCPFR